MLINLIGRFKRTFSFKFCYDYQRSCPHLFLSDSFYFNNHTFISQTVTTNTKPIRSSPVYEYNNFPFLTITKTFYVIYFVGKQEWTKKASFQYAFPHFFRFSAVYASNYIPPYHLFCIVREDVQYNKDILGFLFPTT